MFHRLSIFFCSQDTQYDNPVLDYYPEYGSGSGDGSYDYYASGLATYSPGTLLGFTYDANLYIYILCVYLYKRVYLKYPAPKIRTGTKEEEYDTYDSSGDESGTVTFIPDSDDYDNTITASTSENTRYNYPTPENPLTLPPRRITTPESIGRISGLQDFNSKL